MIIRLIILFIILLPSAITAQENEDILFFEQPVDASVYLLHPGDQLTVTFIRSDLSEMKLTVNAEAEIVNQQLGVINVSGLTLTTARNKILEALQAVYNVKDILISIDKPRMSSYSVRGAVQEPGVYRSYNSKRVSDIIAQAGGLLQDASSRNIVIRDGGDRVYPVDLDKAYYLGNLSSDPFLYMGVDIFVPSQNDKAVQVTGEVNAPRSIELLEDDTVQLLIGLAGGVRSRGDISNVSLIRKNQKITPDNLMAGDIIIVPPQSDIIEKNTVQVFGAIHNPGEYSYSAQMDIGSLLTEAGSLIHDGNVQLITIFRTPRFDLEGRLTDVRFPISFTGRSNDEVYAARLKPGDSIFVPVEVGYVKINGEVLNPGFVPFVAHQTVSYYIKTAGGTLPTADIENIQMFNPVSKLTTVVSKGVYVPDGCELIILKREELQ